jgi:flagellar hook assembly protein FlgD
VLAPLPDGTGAVANASFTLGAPARVTAQLVNTAGSTAATVLAATEPAGLNTFTWSAGSLPDGRYRLVVTATAVGRSVRKAADVVVDRTLAGLSASVLALSPNGDGVSDTTTVTFVLAQSVPVRVDVLHDGLSLGTVFQGQLGAGPQAVNWDGSVAGARLPDGSYELAFTASDALGDVRQTVPLTIDVTPPTLTIVDAGRLTFTLDEPATVTLLVNGQVQIVAGEPAGTFTVPFTGTVSSVVAQAQDFAGNLGARVTG